MDNLFILLIFIGVLVVAIILHHKLKHPKIGSMCMVTGGVKTGKTTFAVSLALKEYKKSCRQVAIVNFFKRLTHKKEIEKPLLYSNIALSVPFVPLTPELILRTERFAYGSIILCSEASLVADSQLITDKNINQQLLLFNKLIGHETKGGKIIYDTQSIQDCHYSIKRCLSEYFYIHHIVKIPFFILLFIREDRYSEDGTVISVNNEDIENTLKCVLIPKSTWRKFDAYTYSIFTDHLPVNNNVVKLSRSDTLKTKKIVSFRNGGYIDTTNNKENKRHA